MTQVELVGELTFDSIMAQRKALLTKMAAVNKSESVVVNLSGLMKVDSAGLGLMVEGVKLAKAKGCGLTYLGLPVHLLRLVEFCGLASILPIGHDE